MNSRENGVSKVGAGKYGESHRAAIESVKVTFDTSVHGKQYQCIIRPSK
jgi:hypothetical protein